MLTLWQGSHTSLPRPSPSASRRRRPTLGGKYIWKQSNHWVKLIGQKRSVYIISRHFNFKSNLVSKNDCISMVQYEAPIESWNSPLSRQKSKGEKKKAEANHDASGHQDTIESAIKVKTFKFNISPLSSKGVHRPPTMETRMDLTWKCFWIPWSADW